MFYVKWFGQFMLVMVLMSIVALLVPPPGIAALILIVVIVWSIGLLTRLVRYLMVPSNPTLDNDTAESSADVGLGAQVALTGSLIARAHCSTRPPVGQRAKAENAAGSQRTCCRPIRTRMPREFRGRSFPLCFVHCRVRRRLPAA